MQSTAAPGEPGEPNSQSSRCACCARRLLLLLVFACAAIFAAAPQRSSAQTSVSEVLGTESARAELAGETLQGKGQAAPKKTPNGAAANKKKSAQQTIDISASAKGIKLSTAVIMKVVATFFLIYVWVLSVDWVNRDSQIHELGYKKWNPIVYAPFALLAIGLFFLPLGTVIRLPILLVVFLATVVPYVVVHNKSVEAHESVLTGAWWRYFFAGLLGKVGVKVSAERKAEYEKGAPVDLLALGAEDVNENNANLLTARQSPGYLLLKDLVVDAITRRSERVRLDYTAQDVKARHEIDGVWHAGESQEREPADVMLAVMKTLANCDAKDRKKPQSGLFGAKYEGHTYTFTLETQGVKTGERVVVTIRGREEQKLESYEDLGMRSAIAEKWSQLVGQDRGLVVLSTMPGDGLTTITDATLNETDRLMRDFVSIEDAQALEAEVQNINRTTYDSAEGQTPDSILNELIRTYPNVYVIRDFVNAETANRLFKEVQDDRLVITTIQGREAAEAPLRLLQMKVSPNDLASTITGVLYQRQIRKLCNDCKVGYTPPPEVLKKLGIPAGKVEKLYRPPKGEEIDKPCKTCQGIGYLGRTGIFELLTITEPMRQVIAKQPKLELLKKAARHDHQRSLQEEGILLVAKGVTSIPELMRVLKS